MKGSDEQASEAQVDSGVTSRRAAGRAAAILRGIGKPDAKGKRRATDRPAGKVAKARKGAADVEASGATAALPAPPRARSAADPSRRKDVPDATTAHPSQTKDVPDVSASRASRKSREAVAEPAISGDRVGAIAGDPNDDTDLDELRWLKRREQATIDALAGASDPSDAAHLAAELDHVWPEVARLLRERRSRGGRARANGWDEDLFPEVDRALALLADLDAACARDRRAAWEPYRRRAIQRGL